RIPVQKKPESFKPGQGGGVGRPIGQQGQGGGVGRPIVPSQRPYGTGQAAQGGNRGRSFGPGGGGQRPGAGGGRPQRGVAGTPQQQEIDAKAIQDKIRQTQAKLAGSSRNKNLKAKYRRNKRDEMAEKRASEENTDGNVIQVTEFISVSE